MKRKHLLPFALAGLFFFCSAFSENTASVGTPPPKKSKYSGQIDQCIEANKQGRAKTITEFVCPGGKLTPQQIAYQTILDLEFKKIDKEVEKDLASMQSASTKDIGEINNTVSEWFDTTAKNPKYPGKYTDICNKTVMDEGMKHFGTLVTDSDTEAFVAGQTKCQALVKKKLRAYKDSAWLLGAAAVEKSYEEDKHDYMRSLKESYEKFLNKWAILLGQFGVIKDKWPTKTKTIQ